MEAWEKVPLVASEIPKPPFCIPTSIAVVRAALSFPVMNRLNT